MNLRAGVLLMIKVELNQILLDLHEISKIPKDKLFQDCISRRLETALVNYCKDLDDNCEYLYNKKEINVLKNL